MIYLIAAASVVVIGGVSAWILLSQEPDVDNLSVTEKFESGKAIVTLEMAKTNGMIFDQSILVTYYGLNLELGR